MLYAPHDGLAYERAGVVLILQGDIKRLIHQQEVGDLRGGQHKIAHRERPPATACEILPPRLLRAT